MAGANPHFRGINGELPLTLAALHRSTSKSTSIVEALLQAGADPNAYSLRGIPILHTACGAVGGDGSMVKLLIEAGAGVNAPSPGDDFVTPLHEAARCNNAPAARILTNMNLCKLNIQASTPSRFVPCGMRDTLNKIHSVDIVFLGHIFGGVFLASPKLRASCASGRCTLKSD